MTVKELLARIIAAYPGATPEAMKTFKPVFQARLGGCEGERLAAAAIEVLASFRPKYGQPFPIPADFEALLPSRARGQPKARPLDMFAHAERMQRLLAQWRRDVDAAPELLHAMELIAHDAAFVAAWHERPAPIVLSERQLKLARHRALSLQRRTEYGPPEAVSRETWWAQISAIAARWKIATAYEDWCP